MNVCGVTNNLSFTAGKVHLYSDFDGTYFPGKQRDLRKNNVPPELSNYCTKMNEFMSSGSNDINLHITSGRNLGEYRSVLNMMDNNNLYLPYPKTFISKNGGDEFIISTDGKASVIEFKVNPEKEFKIKQQTNWDGEKIQDFILDLANKHKKRIVVGESEGTTKDYGNDSLFAKGKLSPNDSTVIGFRNDGKLKINFNMVEDSKFADEVKEYLNKNNIGYSFIKYPLNDFYTSYVITPEFQGGELTKLYDTKEAVKQALINNDIVIAAGDGLNDYEMLNPLEYLPKKGKNLTQAEIEKEIEALPLYSIVVRRKNSGLQPLVDKYAKTGKVIEVEEGKIDEGVRIAIEDYAKRNPEFKNNMSEKLKSMTGKPKSGNKWLKTFGVIAALAVLTTGYFAKDKIMKKKEQT